MNTLAKRTENQANKTGTSNNSYFGRNSGVPFFQPKLTVNTPGDAHEQEADRVADQVMRMKEDEEPVVQRMPLTPVSSVQRMCTDCEEKQEGGVQRKETAANHGTGSSATSIVGQVLSSSGGQPMDSGTRQFMEGRFGQDFGQVRIHTDAQAAESASAIQAKAYTSGRDIVFGGGEYRPESSEGKRLLAHELVHVGQQGFNLHKEPLSSILSDEKRIMRFSPGTTKIIKNAQGNSEYQEGSGHAGMTEVALQEMGLSVDEAREGRMGNWQRDFSQLLTPGFVRILTAEGIMSILNILAIKEFGRGIDKKELGTYDPVEHIDNPAGLRGRDVYNQVVDEGKPENDLLNPPANPDVGVSSILKGKEGDAKKGYANVDGRYSSIDKGPTGDKMEVAAFAIDENAIPGYMNTSKKWLIGKLRQSAALGRTSQGGLGPREFSSGIHTLQDFYAHSNFCEIGINILIRRGNTNLAISEDNEGKKKMYIPNKNEALNTQIHAINPDHSTDEKNLTIRSQNKKDSREVMTTGSFNLTDTTASLLEEIADQLKMFNPFKKPEDGPNELLMACLDYIEMNPENPTDFSVIGSNVSRIIVNFVNTINIEKKSSVFADKLLEFAEAAKNNSHILRKIYLWLHKQKSNLIEAFKELPIIANLVRLKQELRVYLEEKFGALWNEIISNVIGKINDEIELIRQDSNVQRKKTQPGEGSAGRLGGLQDLYDEAGNPMNGIAPKTYTVPSHTEIAKDHDDIRTPVKDGKPDQKDDSTDKFGDNHISNYLAPLATKLAIIASKEIGKEVATCWDVVDKGGTLTEEQLKTIDKIVEKYFCHPADCNYWEIVFQPELQQNARIGKAVSEKLGLYAQDFD